MSVLSGLKAAGVRSSVAAAEAPRAEAAMREAGITSIQRSRYFLAQVLHESGGLYYWEELASGAAYEGRKDLGNTQSGDGRRYKGRGPIQLTGRANYRAAGKALKLNLEGNPTLAARHDVGWRIAAWYWSSRGLNAYADRGDFEGTTRRINGGLNGYADRSRYLRILAKHDVRPREAEFDKKKLTPKEFEQSQLLIRKRKIAARNGGWNKIDASHNIEAEKAKAWLRARANVIATEKNQSVSYRAERVQYLRDVALNRL